MDSRSPLDQTQNTIFLDGVHQGKNAWWQYVLSISLILVCLRLGIPLIRWAERQSADALWHYVSVHLAFLFLLGGLFLAVKWVHQRPFCTLVCPGTSLRLERLGQGLVVWLLLLSIAPLLEIGLHPLAYQWTFAAEQWLVWLPLVLLLTPLQAATEELLFRGYLLQGMSLLSRNFWFLTLSNSLLFASLHLSNPEASSSQGWAFLFYFVAGFFPALITLKDGSLELAIGYHIANNLFVALLVKPKVSVLDTPAILTATGDLDLRLGLVIFGLAAIVFYYVFFARRLGVGFSRHDL
jgi:membrane protease YdiL (CAAX protease family)